MRKNPKYDVFIQGYPNLFKEYPRCGISIGVGWFQLLHSLCYVLDHAIKYAPEEIQPGLFVSQIKEKFGSLRVYMNQDTPYISGAIAVAEHMSSFICEKCGAPGFRNSSGWIKVLCKEHHETEKK